MTPFDAPPTYEIDGQLVILDSDLAHVFDVPTKALNQQVTRNKEKFEDGGAFKLTAEQWADLKSQNVTATENLKSQNVTASSGDQHGGRRTPPRVFTEEGVAMAATVLKSDRAVKASIFIVKVFVEARRNQLALDSGQNPPAKIDPKGAFAQPNPALGQKIERVIEGLLDSIIDPSRRATVRDEAQEVLSEGIASLKALIKSPQMTQERAIADITLKIRAAEKVAAETQAIDVETQHRQFALIVKQLRMVMAAQDFLAHRDQGLLLQMLEDLGDE